GKSQDEGCAAGMGLAGLNRAMLSFPLARERGEGKIDRSLPIAYCLLPSFSSIQIPRDLLVEIAGKDQGVALIGLDPGLEAEMLGGRGPLGGGLGSYPPTGPGPQVASELLGPVGGHAGRQRVTRGDLVALPTDAAGDQAVLAVAEAAEVVDDREPH